MKKKSVVGVIRLIYVNLLFGFAVSGYSADQIWNISGGDDIWSIGSANWDLSSVWTNGNSAIFADGPGESVDISAAVEVGHISFQTNGYVIADADTDGTFTLTGAPSLITVANTSDSGTINEIIAGSSGFTKAGSGTLILKKPNTYTGVTLVSAGTLKLEPGILYVLGATGTGNDTVVADGATIDFNGSYTAASTAEKFTISGTGVNGAGALVNTGLDHQNKSLAEVILAENASVGGARRIDIAKISSAQKTFTKTGTHQLAVGSVVDTEIVVNEGTYTLLGNSLGLGGDTWGSTTVNSAGILNSWGTLTVGERIFFNGGRFQQGAETKEFKLAGHITVSGNSRHISGSNRGVELSGYLDGTGGFTQEGAGWLYVTGATNTYTGATVINSGRSLWVGRTLASDGILGTSAVTNNGYLYANSPLLTAGSLVNYNTVYANYGELASGEVRNSGTLYALGGVLGTGAVYNSGTIRFDYMGTSAISNSFAGTGSKYIRYGGDVILSTGVSTGSSIRVIEGSLTFTNGASYTTTYRFNVTDRQDSGYATEDLGPMTAVVNVTEGSILNLHSSEFGNGYTTSNWVMNATLNQYGGTVRTYGRTDEDNGIRIAHWPQANGLYNMMGGTLVIDNGYDLGIATDGSGWVHQVSGEIYTSRVMLNERNGSGGFGRLTVEGGVLNIGLTNGILNVEQNGIMADTDAPYLVEYGGAGGIVRAVTNFVAPAHATLSGSGADAITFDTQEWEIDQSGNLTGDGGFNKSGSGSLILSGNNTYTGVTQVLEGQVTIASATALPAGGTVLFGVTDDDTGGRLHSDGDLDLSGIVAGVANPDDLDKSRIYTIATYAGNLTGVVASHTLPYPWYLSYDSAAKRVKLLTPHGTVLIVR